MFLDSLARDGVHCANAFVTTALCSPSRASILTGKYAHQHKIVDNNTAIPPGTTFFPQLLPKAGYATSFFGKWHMGNGGDEPQPGFDRWVSFRGTYLPGANGVLQDGDEPHPQWVCVGRHAATRIREPRRHDLHVVTRAGARSGIA